MLLAAISNSLENRRLIMAAEMPYNDIEVNECFIIIILFLLIKGILQGKVFPCTAVF